MGKRITKIFISLVVFIGALFVYLAIFVPFDEIYNLPESVNLSDEDIVQIQENKPFGKLIAIKTNDIIEVSSGQIIKKTTNLDLKLFGLIKIRSINILENPIEVITGGNIVGFSLTSRGVVVVGSSPVLTENGNVNTLENIDIKNGDIITNIGEDSVNRISDISVIINKQENHNKELEITIKRKGETLSRIIKPAKDLMTNTYKLGLWIKDDASGVGTLTYIRKDNNRFGALGHAICDTDTKEVFEINSGDLYSATVIGINKGQKGKPGELKALFIQGSNNLGSVDKNTKYGVFGTIKEEKISKFSKAKVENVGGRLTAKPGKAFIRASLDGEQAKDYQIEIIKTNYQNVSSDKSMVIRVVDKELLNKTGGIIQGMSGSPIIQNGRVIGAVTHVFISDPTKGFGIYLDWMINQ